MLDWGPFNLLEERCDCDRRIRKHKYREREEVFYHLFRRTVDYVPFGDDRYEADDKYQHINDHTEIENRQHTEIEEVEEHGVINENGDTVDKFTDTAKKRKYREHKCRENRHQHIVASKRATEDTFEERSTVFTEDLIEALRPTQTLVPRLFEGYGLFVINDRAAAVTDGFALDRHINRKFDIFGKKMVFPTVVFLDDFTAYTEAGTRNRTRGAEAHSCVVKVFRFTKEPERITCGYPVCAVVFGVTIACERFISPIEVCVHLFDEVFINKVIGVEDHICIAIIFFRKKLFEKEVERIALTDKFFIISFKNDRAVLSADFGSVIRAVIGNQENLYEFARIILTVDTFEKVSDNVFFVTGTDYNTEFVEFITLYGLRLIFSEENPENIEELIEITDYKRTGKNYITQCKYILNIHGETSVGNFIFTYYTSLGVDCQHRKGL